jgi:uncharacterized RDD family membrane protein YckC
MIEHCSTFYATPERPAAYYTLADQHNDAVSYSKAAYNQGMPMDDRYSIDTPEQIAFDYDIAGIGSRFLAAFIDSFILWLLSTVISVLTALVLDNLTDDFAGLGSVGAAVLGIISFLFLWGYFLFFEVAWSGQTPGKRIVGLRVVREGGRPITFGAAAIRNLIRVVDFLPLFYGIGVVTMFIDSRSRRLGDLAAGTLVVKSRRDITLDSLASAMPPPFTANGPTPTTLPNLHLLNRDDYNLVQEFLRRRDELAPDVQQRLGAQLATRLRTRLELPPDEADERLIERVAVEYPLGARTS